MFNANQIPEGRPLGKRLLMRARDGASLHALVLAGLLVGGLELVSGCKGGSETSPLYDALVAYKASVEPPLQASEALSKRFEQIVSSEKVTLPDGGTEINPDNAAQRLQDEILPLAQTFKDQVAAVAPGDPTVAEVHQVLAVATQLKLEGYQLMLEGYRNKDVEKFSLGYKKAQDSAREELTYYERIDQLMQSQGLELLYFTAGAPGAPANPGAPASP